LKWQKKIAREGLVDNEYDDEHLMAMKDMGRWADYDMKGVTRVSVGDEEFGIFFCYFVLFLFCVYLF
jgi:hypothetical protein